MSGSPRLLHENSERFEKLSSSMVNWVEMQV